MMSFGVTYVAGLFMVGVNCSFSCAYDIGVLLLRLGAARSAVRSLCCSVVMSFRFSVMLCVIGVGDV